MSVDQCDQCKYKFRKILDLSNKFRYERSLSSEHMCILRSKVQNKIIIENEIVLAYKLNCQSPRQLRKAIKTHIWN